MEQRSVYRLRISQKSVINFSIDDDEPKKKIEKEDSTDLTKQNEALAKVNELLKKETRVVEGSSLSLLANQYR